MSYDLLNDPNLNSSSGTSNTPVTSPASVWHIDTLSSLADIQARKAEWTELEGDTIDPHAAFQSYCWCESWARTYCTDSKNSPQPNIFFVYNADELVAILPMMLVKRNGLKGLNLFGQPHSQISNLLVKANRCVKEGVQICITQAQRVPKVDFISLGALPEGSPLLDILDPNHIDRDPADCMSMITWPKFWRSEDYVASLSKNRRKDFNHKNNRLMKLGEIRYAHVGVRDAAFSSLVEKVIEWKRKWLITTGKYSVGLSYENFDDFLTGFKASNGAFEPELDVLFVNNKPVAISVNILGRDYISCYLTSYDPDYTQSAAGMLLYQYAVRDGIDDGLVGYNFLGYPTPFKLMWSTEFVPLYRYQYAISFRGRLWVDLWSKRLRPKVKQAVQLLARMRTLPVAEAMLSRVLSRKSAK